MSLRQPHQIHVIEDNEPDFVALRRAIVWALSQTDGEAEFFHHSSAEQAFDALLQGQRPDLTFIDINLTGESGLKFLKRVRHEPRIVPFPKIILTTSKRQSDVQEAFQQGAAGYLLKSIDSGELREAVRISLDYWFRASLRPLHDADSGPRWDSSYSNLD